MPLIEMALAGAIAQGVAGAVRSWKKVVDSDPATREKFDFTKFSVSILIGAGIGAGLGLAGFDLTSEGIQGLIELVGTNYLLMNGVGAAYKTGETVSKKAEG